MKKSLTVLALAFGITSAFAQDLTSKKGEPILPEAGDWALGVDATPFLNYLGNFFGKNASNVAPTFNFLNVNQTITGKYFKDAQTAYRASVRIGFGGNTSRNSVSDRTYNPTGTTTNYPNQDPTKENSFKHSTSNIGLSVGIEKRKGKTRLQGYYGAELGINFSSSKDKYKYGNALNVDTLNAANEVIVTADDNFGGNLTAAVPGLQGMIGTARVTDRKNGTSFGFGVRAFVGVEYFILPKISLGGEFGWGLGFVTGGKTTTTYESIGQSDLAKPNQRQVATTKIETPHQGSFALDTDHNNSLFGPSASIRLNFHF